jgi:hypothetical protein
VIRDVEEYYAGEQAPLIGSGSKLPHSMDGNDDDPSPRCHYFVTGVVNPKDAYAQNTLRQLGLLSTYLIC